MSKPRPRRWAFLQDAAAYAGGCHVNTIRRRIADGSLPGYRMGGRVVVDLDAVDAMLVKPIPTVGTVRVSR